MAYPRWFRNLRIGVFLGQVFHFSCFKYLWKQVFTDVFQALTSRWRIDGKGLPRFPRLSSSVDIFNRNQLSGVLNYCIYCKLI